MFQSQKSFESWQMLKEETERKKHKLILEKMKQEHEKLDEIKQKKMDSDKFFNAWKSKKDEQLHEIHRQKKEQERAAMRRESVKHEEKLDSATKVFDNW